MSGPQDEKGDQGRKPTSENLQAVFEHLQNSGSSAAAPSTPSPEQGAWAKRLSTWGPIGVIVVLALSKLKWVLIAFNFLKLQTLLTMFLSVGVYSLHFGLPFAAGFVLLIFVHEMGHALAMRRLGIPAGAPVFIPFVGAVIAMKGMPRDAWIEALVGIAGPVMGTLGAFVCLIIAWVSGADFWYALAYVGFFLNLFNMIPMSPLDGGRIVGVVSRWLWAIGYAVGIGVFLMTYSPILFLILLLGLFSLRRTVRGGRSGYYDVPASRRAAMGAAYFGLVVLLVLGLQATERPLKGISEGAGKRDNVFTTERAEGPESISAHSAAKMRPRSPLTTVRRAGETLGRSGRTYSFVGHGRRFD